MSLDIWFERLPCEHCKRGGETVWERSPTYNLANMWRAAGLPFSDDIENKPAGELIPALERGIAALRADPAKFRAMEPANKWGTHEDLLEVAESCLAAAREYPTAIVTTWR